MEGTKHAFVLTLVTCNDPSLSSFLTSRQMSAWLLTWRAKALSLNSSFGLRTSEPLAFWPGNDVVHQPSLDFMLLIKFWSKKTLHSRAILSSLICHSSNCHIRDSYAYNYTLTSWLGMPLTHRSWLLPVLLLFPTSSPSYPWTVQDGDFKIAQLKHLYKISTISAKEDLVVERYGHTLCPWFPFSFIKK